jgi:hypothetical protein
MSTCRLVWGKCTQARQARNAASQASRADGRHGRRTTCRASANATSRATVEYRPTERKGAQKGVCAQCEHHASLLVRHASRA